MSTKKAPMRATIDSEIYLKPHITSYEDFEKYLKNFAKRDRDDMRYCFTAGYNLSSHPTEPLVRSNANTAKNESILEGVKKANDELWQRLVKNRSDFGVVTLRNQDQIKELKSERDALKKQIRALETELSIYRGGAI